jgi:dolichol-phosphate mannosyltransferase
LSTEPQLSIVVPVYNEAANLEVLFASLHAVLEEEGYNYEVIFIDDGSTDGTFEVVKQLHERNAAVKGYSFSRNFGHQTALFAGLSKSTGEVVISMDGDMQHPPEFIPALLKKYEEGYDIVNTKRLDAESTGLFKKLSSRWYYKMLNALSDVPIEPAAADFRLMNRKSVEALNSLPETHRFTRGLVGWMGFKQAIIPYQAAPRHAGSSKYTFFKMLRFGLDGIVSFSVKPLRIAFYTGVMVSIAALLYAIYAIVQHILGSTVEGWTSILVSVLFIGGVTLLSLGVIGEYIARIFNEVRRRPMYFFKDQTNED